jgi:hypothetical protein
VTDSRFAIFESVIELAARISEHTRGEKVEGPTVGLEGGVGDCRGGE